MKIDMHGIINSLQAPNFKNVKTWLKPKKTHKLRIQLENPLIYFQTS